MSPEQLHGETPSPAWDVWALPAPGIEALFRRALAPEPAGRPASVRQLLDELGQVLRAEAP